MQKHSMTKFLSAFLASVTLFGSLSVIPASAAEDEQIDGTYGSPAAVETDATESESSSALEFFNNLASGDAGKPYLEYLAHYKAERAKKSILIDAVGYDAENTTAAVEPLKNYEGVPTALYIPSSGITSWKINVPDDAYYSMRITYFPLENYKGKSVSTYTTIERTFYIDGHIPFSEARYFYFPRNWEYIEEDRQLDEDGNYIFEKDASGNDIRPIRVECPEWQTYYLRDWLGYTPDPFEFYFSKGEHVISFEGSREPMVISKIELYPFEEEPTYEEFLQSKLAEGVEVIDEMGDDVIKVQAENPVLISNACLFPINDRTSSLTEPQDPQKIRFNILNSTTVNQWMKYKVTVPKDGLYTIAIRFRQNDLIGMFTSRRILINDEIQFREASSIRFKYKSSWQSQIANDGKQEFKFYLKAGENTITFEAVLGEMANYVYRVEQIIETLNTAYKKILQLTGPSPDTYRDYGFNRLVPEAVKAIGQSAEDLNRIADELEEVTGELGDQVATLKTYATTFEKMGEDEYEIAPNFVTYKNYIIGLSNWLYASLNQPLKMDYFTVQGENDDLPRSVSNFFESIWFEIRAFVGSFTMDYTTVDFKSKDGVEYTEDNTVEMWITTATTTQTANAVGGRDGALVDRYLIDNYFTPDSGITVKIKIITAGLTEAVLAGIGPDVSTMTSVDTITWGLRSAVYPLDDMPGFDEAVANFSEAAITPLQMTDAKGKFRTYGMPQNMNFFMMFYRADVLENAGVPVPETWQDLYNILPTLQNSDMEIGMPGALKAGSTTLYEVNGLDGLKIFLYQMGGQLYNDGGYSVTFDDNVALDAFESYCDMFSKYKSPVEYDLTRFRSGEVPIYFGDAISTYNIMMSYYDIRGLWKMAPLLATEREDGTLDRTSPVTVTSMVIPGKNIEQKRAETTWQYIKWRTSPETQGRLARENLAVNANPTVKYNSSTIDGLLSQAWNAEEYKAIETQLKSLVGIPEYPGNYIIKTYVNSAFLVVRSSSSNAADELLDRLVYINKELSRKRDDFKMDYFDVSTGKYHAGRYVSEPMGLTHTGKYTKTKNASNWSE